MQEKFQLRNNIRNLKKELFNLKKIESKEKNEFIYNLIDKQNIKLMILMKKNDYLKKDIKLTKINEFFIEGEKIEEQIQKIKN